MTRLIIQTVLTLGWVAIICYVFTHVFGWELRPLDITLIALIEYQGIRQLPLSAVKKRG